MTPERLAEFQEARRKLLAGDMPDEPVSAAFVELIDALTAERERAEKAEAELDKLNQSGDLGMNAKQEKFSFRERRQ